MDEMFKRPANCVISDDDAILVTLWGTKHYEIEKYTDHLRILFTTQYSTDPAEFDLLGPELRFLLQDGLDDDDKRTLHLSLNSRGIRDTVKSPEQKQLTNARKCTLAKVYRSFTKLRREIYPELESRFKSPEAIPKAYSTTADDDETADETADESAEEVVVTPPRVAKRSTFITPVDAISPTEPTNDEDVVDVDDDCVIVPYKDDLKMVEILQPLDEILMDFGGVCAVVSNEYDIISEYLQKKDKVPIHLTNPTSTNVVYDVLIAIPPANQQILVLTTAIANRIPFFIFLPFSVFTKYALAIDVCRLNLIIIGSDAWFVCCCGVGFGDSFWAFETRFQFWIDFSP